jgi:hypothetical protein
MEKLMDAIIAIVERASESWLGIFVLTSPMWLLTAVRIRETLQRRRAFQDFARAHQLEFVGTIPSDGRAPYTQIDRVRGGPLLSNVLEGRWDGLPISLFDSPRGRSARWTMVLVTVEGRLLRGSATERAVAAHPDALIETNLDVLCVSPWRSLDASEFAAWLSFATTLAKAMERDAKEESPLDGLGQATQSPRGILGLFSAE